MDHLNELDNNVNQLLHDVSEKLKKYEKDYFKKGKNFNLFDITGISTNEVKICRVMCELLSPSGSHGQGDIFLNHFIETVINKKMDENQIIMDEEINSAKVYTEYSIEEKKRIDIVIKIDKHFIPIEVKIGASDRKEQCYAYAKKAKYSKLFYLTKSGKPPASSSINSSTDEEKKLAQRSNLGKENEDKLENIACISFCEDILKWLMECKKDERIKEITPVSEGISQLISVIRGFTGQLDESEKREIMNVIKKSPNNIRAADEVCKCLKDTKTELMMKLFEGIENNVEKQLKEENPYFKKLDNEYDYTKKVGDYYKNKPSTHPGLSYKFKTKDQVGVDVWVRINIHDRIEIGYCCPKNGEYKEEEYIADVKKFYKIKDEEEKITKLPNKIIHKIINNKYTPNPDSWWLYWEYLPDNVESNTPFFNEPNHNKAYYDLFDETIFKEFTEKCANKVVEFLEFTNN